MPVCLIGTDVANTASVSAAFERLGCEVCLSTDPSTVRSADAVVLPGVGHFAAGMEQLLDLGLVDPLRDRIARNLPTLGICLGMQLLADGSDEAPGVPGLGVLKVRATRFDDGVVVPQLGWNGVAGSGRYVDGGAAYYANSFRLAQPPTGWQASFSDHGGRFLAAVERGRVLACQFHPELSGAWGSALLERWLLDRPVVARHAASRVGPRVIPCLDVADGRVVKGVRFQGLRDAGDPVALARAYAEQGADELVMLDVSATPAGRATAADTVRAIRAVLDIPLTVGGGVRTVDDAARLLQAGADKVAVNSAAVARPALLTELADRFGSQCVVLALDAARCADAWEVVVQSGKKRTGLDAVDWAAEATSLGAGEVLLTSWDRDGTGDGYDTALLDNVSARVCVPVIASGGARNPADLAAAVRAGASAVLAASIFHDGEWTVSRLKAALDTQGLETRT